MAVIGVMLMFLIQLSLLAPTQCSCENCDTCQGTNTCLLCIYGYYLSNGICTLCQDNCQNCYNETACLQCFVGFYLDTDTGSCPACRPGCKACDRYTECRYCEDRYYLDDGECITCTIKCTRCLSSTRCTSCYQGFWGSTNCANSCPGGCNDSACDLYGNCVECHDGRYGKQCQYPCPGNCISNKCSITGLCREGCKPGFYGIICDQNCLLDTCPNNECFQNNGSCVSTCPEICQTCKSLTSCTSCKQGQYGTVCENQCPGSNCKECNQGTGTCLKCNDGHFLSGTVCIGCSIECKTCEGPTSSKCMSCTKGYFLDDNQCKTCNDGCSDCSWYDNCNECRAGYFLATSDCTKCPTNCKTCTSMNQCLSCVNEYQGNTCDSFVCPEQKYSRSLGTDSCECDKQKCSFKNGDTCLACNERGWYPSGPGCCPCAVGTYENNDACVTCPEHCIPKGQCNTSTGACIEGCEDRWWGLKCDQRCNDTCKSCLRDGTCATCNQNCHTVNGNLVCDDMGRCSGCKPGFFGTQCTNECSDGCGKDDDGVRSCRQEDGGCEFGCEVGFHGRACAEKESSSSSALIGGVVGGIVAALTIAAMVVVCFIRRRHLGCLGNKKENTGNQPVDETVGGESGYAVEYVDLQERSDNDRFYSQLGLNDTNRSTYAALGDQSRDNCTYSELQTGTKNDHVVTTPAEYENMADPTGFRKQYENIADQTGYGKQYENV